jgi:hypothetical protein
MSPTELPGVAFGQRVVALGERRDATPTPAYAVLAIGLACWRPAGGRGGVPPAVGL